MGALQKFQKFRVLWHRRTEPQKFREGTKHAVPVPRVLRHGSYRTHGSSGYGYGSLTEILEVADMGGRVSQNAQNCRVLWHGRTELPEVSGSGISVLQKLQKFFVG